MVSNYLKKRKSRDLRRVIIFLVWYVLLTTFTVFVSIGLIGQQGFTTIFIMVAHPISLLYFGLVILSLIRYRCSRAYISIKAYGNPESIIGRIEEKIKDEKYIYFHYNEKKEELVFIDEQELLCISGIFSGYCEMKDVIWSYYNTNDVKQGSAQLFVWGEKRINSFQFLNTKSAIFEIINILEKYSNALLEYRQELKDTRSYSYSGMVKAAKEIKYKSNTMQK
jgi:hypothetical protein